MATMSRHPISILAPAWIPHLVPYNPDPIMFIHALSMITVVSITTAAGWTGDSEAMIMVKASASSSAGTSTTIFLSGTMTIHKSLDLVVVVTGIGPTKI